MAGELAEKRKARGLKLNYPESIALISSRLQEAARDGKTVAELMQYGATILSREDVMEGIIDLAPYVNANLEIMEHDTKRMRKGNPFVFTNLMSLQGIDDVIGWIKKYALLEEVSEPQLYR